MVAFSALLPVRLIDYGLRDYGTAKWEGGDPNCDHNPQKPDGGDRSDRTLPLGRGGVYQTVCGKCGAIRIDEQIGLEQTPDEYIANLVEVFRECKRILRDDGTLWVNIGDSYNGSAPNQSGQNGYNDGRENRDKRYSTGGVNGLKPKDLIGIPWMLAFALRADGWYLRQDIIWAKPNPMPESVKDRCTKSHEYIFLLSKSARYYYDNDAVREPLAASTLNDIRIDCMSGRPNKKAHELVKNGTHGSGGIGDPTKKRSELINLAGRNKRDVWTVTTKPYKGAHYATFNPELIKPCILAGAPETCCAKCGAPYERIVEKTGTNASNEKGIAEMIAKGVPRTTANLYVTKERGNSITTGYRPTCNCNAGTSSGIVFDPFVGSGTTVATAIQLGRKGIGIDLSFKYLQENAKARVESAELPLLNFIEQ